jgi:GNAT superfamily N-acetyltransferase
MSFKTIVTETPPAGAYAKLLGQLRDFNQARVGHAQPRTLAILMTAPTTDDIIGGLWGSSIWGSFYIDMLFVPQNLRGQGIGRDLLRQAEAEALARGCQSAWVDTYDFQARGFYERLGYTVFGVIDGEAPVFPRFFLKKRLA